MYYYYYYSETMPMKIVCSHCPFSSELNRFWESIIHEFNTHTQNVYKNDLKNNHNAYAYL